MTPEPTTPDDHANTRLQRLEEAQGFLEHTNDALAEQVRALERRVHDTALRLATLESRLARLIEHAGDDEAPPDAAA
ncbi:MAG: hypothetical protein HBSAPP03_27980 [Phycisphaerae bacterium]|nr:MAG: hypothetical protein HBSAPP03_27980 [Phycisphaerae bacterium]